MVKTTWFMGFPGFKNVLDLCYTRPMDTAYLSALNISGTLKQEINSLVTSISHDITSFD